MAVAILVSVSGLGWLVVHELLAQPDEFGVVHHPLEPWLLRLHGAASMAALFVFGSLARDHALAAWRRHRHRWSGGVLIAGCALLVSTGYALYYVGSEVLRPWISVSHWVIGIAALPAFVVHRRAGRRHRARRDGLRRTGHHRPALPTDTVPVSDDPAARPS